MDFLDKVKDELALILTTIGLRVVYALLIAVIGSILVKYFLRALKKGKMLARLDNGIRSFLLSFIRILLYILLFVTAAVILGVPVTSFVTLLASGGLAVGLALQGALSNLAGGIMILIFKPFAIGDYIQSADGDGTVNDITIFYTKLLTYDNKQITIPNGKLTGESITNCTVMKTRRVDLNFTASYSDNIDLVKQVLLQEASQNSMVLSEPAPAAIVSSYNDSSVSYVLRAWCNTQDYWTVTAALNESVKNAFDKNGIEIPFPQLVLHNK